ncbi:MAG: galactose mutarotase [Pseudomonadota bacterium]
MTPFCTLPDGRTVHAVNIANDRLSATFLTLGARLWDLRFDDSGSLVPDVPPEVLTGAGEYTGVIVGPVMNRLSGATAPLDNGLLTFEANEGPNLLHSGKDGVHAKLWQVAEAGPDAVTFRIDLPPDAFPGTRRIEAAYALDGADLVLDLTATTDTATLMNVGFHPYWTLTGGGPETHEVQVNAADYVPATAANIPLGTIDPVAGTSRDFRAARVPTPDIDNCFVLAKRGAQEAAVRLTGGGLALDILTDAPAVHVFTGQPYGIAVEPEIHPDAPNRPAFPSIRLGAGEVFRQRAIHRFSHG